MQAVLIIAIVAAVVIAGPLLLIWSLNTLFPVLAIPYALETWFAVLIVSGVFKSTVKVNK